MRLQSASWLAASLAVLLTARGATGQGNFQNLDFESATVTPVPGGPGVVYASNAIPGWTAYLGGNPQNIIGYDGMGLGGAAVFLGSSGIFW